MTDSNAKQKEYYRKNKDSILEARRAYYAKNKNRITELQKAVRRANPARTMLINAKYRAKQWNLDFDLELADISIPELCPVLHVPLVVGKRDWYNPSLDRIDNSKGYVKGNVQVISYKANAMKNSATRDELLKFAYWVTASFGLFGSDKSEINDKTQSAQDADQLRKNVSDLLKKVKGVQNGD